MCQSPAASRSISESSSSTSVGGTCTATGCSLDIGNAFLRGLSFEELATQGKDGSPTTLREACFDPPADVFTLLQSYEKFKGAHKFSHLLKLLKGAYGLKDAPNLWKKSLEAFFGKIDG